MEPAHNRSERVALIVYILYALSYLIGITCIAGIIIAYVKKNDVDSEEIRDHFRWQINTFWGTILLVILGVATLFIGVGWLILFGATIWNIYRIVKGWLKLNDGVSPYQKKEKK